MNTAAELASGDYRMFSERGIPVTIYGVAMALERNAVAAMLEADWEIASHRWIDYKLWGGNRAGAFAEGDRHSHQLQAVVPRLVHRTHQPQLGDWW